MAMEKSDMGLNLFWPVSQNDQTVRIESLIQHKPKELHKCIHATRAVQIWMQVASQLYSHICYNKMVNVSIKDYMSPLNWH